MAPPDCQALLLQACMEQGEHVRAWKALCLTESLSLVDLTITSSEIVCVRVCVCVCVLVTQSCLILTTPGTVAHYSPLSIGFYRQEYWSE